MFFIYDKKKKVFSPREETDFSSHKIMERQDLEKWVTKSPETLLGEDLLIITTEYDKFDRTSERLDLLALDKNGKLVIIELKRDDSGKTVDLQAIKYAAYCSTMTMVDLISLRKEFLSKNTNKQIDDEVVKKEFEEFVDDEFEELDNKPRIVLVAKNFRQEVTATVLWLRRQFGVDISCVRLTPFEIDDDRLGFVSSILIPLPEAGDFLIESERKESIKRTLTRTRREYLEFYRELVNSMKDSLPIYLPEPNPQSYYQIPTGISGVHFEWGFHGRPRSSFGVELHFEKGNKQANRALLKEIEKSKKEIEKETGEKVVFQEDWGRSWARLYMERIEGKMTDELKEWAIEKMLILHRLLQPVLDTLGKK